MKEEFEEEFIEEIQENEESIEEVVVLTEDEEDDTTGGAIVGSTTGGTVTNCGNYKISTSASTINIMTILTKIGIVDKVTWINRNGAGYSYGAGFFWVKRSSKLGQVSFKVEGHRPGGNKKSRFIKCYVTFK